MAVKLCAWATVWATTTAQCTLGTIQDGELEKIKNWFQFRMCEPEKRPNNCSTSWDHIGKNLYQVSFDR